MVSFLIVIFALALLPYAILLTYIICSLLLKKRHQRLVNNFVAPVSLILTCFNEEPFIAKKISSLLDERNWIKGSEIIVATGGSSDSTNAELKIFNDHPFISVYFFEHRISKIQGVNYAVSKARNDFLVFSDFRQDMKPGAIASLLRNFSDPTVGTVSGTLVDTFNSRNPSFTRSLLNTMAINESQRSSSLNVFGALYAQRKECFVEIPEDILFDDLFVTASTLAQN